MLTFNKITRYGSGCSKDFRQASLLPVNKPKSGFNIMNIWGDKNYFDPNFRYYDPLTDTHEEFRDIVGFEGRNQVSNFGRVLSAGKNEDYVFDCIYKPMKRMGYLRVKLNRTTKYSSIHKLVGAAFIENPSGLPVINHKDSIRHNNFVHNLEWCTNSYNSKYGYDHGNHKRMVGESHPMAKLKESDILKIYELLKNGVSQHKISSLLNIDRGMIKQIKEGTAWKHLNLPILPSQRIGESHKNSKLKSENIIEIWQALNNGVTCHELSKKFSVSDNTIRSILLRKTWKHITDKL